MFIIGKIISDGDTNFTQHKYNKLPDGNAPSIGAPIFIRVKNTVTNGPIMRQHLLSQRTLDQFNCIIP